MQIKGITLTKGILSVAAISLLTGCVDDKYDLTDIDTTSRFTVDNLTVPINLKTLSLKNVIDIADDDPTIKIETVDGKEIYTIKKEGDITPTNFNLSPVTVAEVAINSVQVSPNLDGVPSGVVIPSLNQAFDLQLDGKGLQNYNFNFNNIDKALMSLDKIQTSDIKINVVLSIPSGLLNGTNKISFQGLSLTLPKELTGVNCAVGSYNEDTHTLSISEIPVESDGKARLLITANGLQLGEAGVIGNDHSLHISGKIGLESAKIKFDIAQVELPRPFNIDINYSISGFDVKTFSGEINYDMDDIKIDPISLNDLPDFLNNSQTNIIIDNPVIFVSIVNPVGKYGLKGHGKLNLVSNFSNGSTAHSGEFNLTGEVSKLAFCADKSKFKAPAGYSDYTPVEISGLDMVLTNGDAGLPKNISVSVTDLVFFDYVNNLPLGNLGDASGDYKFNAPFAFGNGTRIYYNTTENGWSSEDLDDVNITLLKLHALCTSKLPVDISLKVQPIDKNGHEIEVEEVKSFRVPANCTQELATLELKGKNGKPIKDFDGVIFEAVIEQNGSNTEALGPNIELELNDLRITVDGYYEKKF